MNDLTPNQSKQDDLDIDEDVGLTSDELSEITDNIDFEEIDSLDKTEEIPSDEIDSLDLDEKEEPLDDFDQKENEVLESEEEVDLSEAEVENESDFALDEEASQVEEATPFHEEKKPPPVKEDALSLNKEHDFQTEEVIKLSNNEMSNLLSGLDEQQGSASNIAKKKVNKKSPPSRSKKPSKKTASKKSIKVSKTDNNILLNKETKELLFYLDKQLSFIPDEKLAEFVKSQYYGTYLKLMNSIK